MNIISKLIPIGTCPSFGDGLIDTVNARDLQKSLQVGCDYTSWVKRRIDESLFIENVDYVVCSSNLMSKTGSGGHNKKECFLTLDAAKHFAMLERNVQGFKVRQYFVEFEKQAKKMLPAQTYQELVAGTLKANSELIARLGQEIEIRDARLAITEPKATVYDAHCGRTLTLRKYTGTLKGVHQNEAKRSLYLAGIFYKANGGYRVYAQYRDTHFEEKANQYSEGKYDIYILPKGKELVAKLYREGKLVMKKGHEVAA